MINDLKIIFAVIIVTMLITVAVDYGDHIRQSTAIQRIQYDHSYEMQEICKMYREFQKSIDGKHAEYMNSLCTDVETKTQ